MCSEMIFGPLDGLTNGYPYQGRSEDKYYLYEIVSNKVQQWNHLHVLKYLFYRFLE